MKTKEKEKRHTIWDGLERAKKEIGADIRESLVRGFGDSFKLKNSRTHETD